MNCLDYRLTGRNLIEAAAGTGKTYTIECLTVRFLLEKRLPIRSILAVTFTEAAAAELKERIRSTLVKMLDAPESGREQQLFLRAEAAGVPREEAEKLLRRALLDFDDANISTIHGFCLRVLGENAFESGVLFRSELLKDVSGIVNELGMNFYRETFYRNDGESEARAALAAAAGITPKSLTKLVFLQLAHPRIHFLADVEWGQPAELKGMLEHFCEHDSAAALEQLVPLLNKIDGTPARLRELLENPWAPGALGELTAYSATFLNSKIPKRAKEDAVRKARELIETGNFALLDPLPGLIRGYETYLELAAAGSIHRELEARKKRDNILTFNDLLDLVHRALSVPGSPLLAALRGRFRAGIVDEFQDTDPVQYEIFDLLFPQPDSTLYMVGDPRQAIYAFRGGDIATYRRAVRELETGGGVRYNLAVNYRSAPAMIGDVNLIFARHARPFADREIGFPEVQAPEGAEAASGHPLRIVRVPDASAELCRQLATAKTLELLAEGFRPRDIALLVFTNREGDELCRLLRGANVPAVFTRVGSVFSSEDATELLTALRAASGGGAPLFNMLGTPLGGKSLAEIVALRRPENMTEFEKEQTRFRRLQLLWEEGGSFIEFFQAFLAAYRIRERYPLLPGGERKLTNLLQLGDILQQESAKRNLTPAGVTDFLAGKIADPESASGEEYMQLLETDREAVKIMTVHGSKGLEVPVVLLPGLFLGDAGKRAGAYHNAEGVLEYDLSDSPGSVLCAANEQLEELLRLAYVALTRAKFRCFLYWGKPSRGSVATPLDWLFCRRELDPAEQLTPIELLAQAPEPRIPPELLEFQELPAESSAYRPDAQPIELELLATRLGIDAHWRFISYSSLMPQGGDSPYDYDREEGAKFDHEEAEQTGIFSIRGGAAAGNAWHRILELADFDADEAQLRQIALPQLRDFGLLRAGEEAEEKLALTVGMIQDVLASPLAGEYDRFALKEIPRRDRLSDLEFLYELRNGFTGGDVAHLLAPYAKERFGLDTWPEWNHLLSGGCFNGCIDLLFRRNGRYYILDWKSNRLEGKLGNFQPGRLTGEMRRHFYFLQYLIYAVATVKYLRTRLGRFDKEEYEAQFGGVFYCFIRGMSPAAPGRGVFYDRPAYELVAELERVIG